MIDTHHVTTPKGRAHWTRSLPHITCRTSRSSSTHETGVEKAVMDRCRANYQGIAKI